MVAFASFLLIQDYPDTARFLNKEERLFVVRRLQADGQFSAAGEQLRWRDVKKGITDWKTWVGASVVIGKAPHGPNTNADTHILVSLSSGTDGPLYAFSLFLPSIISQLGESDDGLRADP